MLAQNISITTGAEIAYLLQKTINEHPPVSPQKTIAIAAGHGARPLGTYLTGLGYITESQLQATLQQQGQYREQGTEWTIGDLLVQKGVIKPQVLSTVLMVQLLDRLLDPCQPQPQLLGEHLIVRGIITPTQLAHAIQQQLYLQQTGTRVRLGYLLIQQGLLDTQTLTEVLHDQWHAHNQFSQTITTIELT